MRKKYTYYLGKLGEACFAFQILSRIAGHTRIPKFPNLRVIEDIQSVTVTMGGVEFVIEESLFE